MLKFECTVLGRTNDLEEIDRTDWCLEGTDLQPAGEAIKVGVHSLRKSPVPPLAHTPASSPAQAGTAPRHPQLLPFGVPQTHPTTRCREESHSPQRPHSPEENGLLNIFHESLLKTSSE